MRDDGQSDCGQRAGQSLALLASYLQSAQFELQVLLLVEQLLQAIGQNDVGVVEAAILLVKLVVLVVFHARRHTVIRHGCVLVLVITACVDESASACCHSICGHVGICRASLHPTAQKINKI